MTILLIHHLVNLSFIIYHIVIIENEKWRCILFYHSISLLLGLLYSIAIIFLYVEYLYDGLILEIVIFVSGLISGLVICVCK